MPWKPPAFRFKKPHVPRPQYGKDHKAMREQLLDTHPLCQMCEKEWSVEAHHLRYPARSITDYLALCVTCHKQVEREKQG
ncbi:hypothetical protein PX52LOC_03504 [Limnoglobus roseus]|uniref:HNH endonuclease n=1 Tax=Limnoglobus roseus TaxID=2598579 RepID=A0A5C1AHE7_9BACT|nr:hypothetical protein PX52LOC_03504 [Limnoglobus roseus]